MGNFSKDPEGELVEGREKGYLGVRFEQGVPVLDRDLNLLAGLAFEAVREVLSRHLGSGLAGADEAFAVGVVDGENDFLIRAPAEGGACLVGGIEARIRAPIRYGEQAGAAPLTTPADADRVDLVYLDLRVEEVDAQEDPSLGNLHDVGVQTTVRLRPTWRVRVAEGSRDLPPTPSGHAFTPLALLERVRGEGKIEERMIVDLRRTGLNLAELARRVQRLEDVLLSTSPLEELQGGGERGVESERWARSRAGSGSW